MRLVTTLLLATFALVVAACVPADQALPLGSAEFTITGRGSPQVLDTTRLVDGWSVHIDRFLVSFKTMTIVNLQASGQCSYRGSGLVTNVVFDGVSGSAIQSFNGMNPGSCPDVGMRLGVPDDFTVPGDGATVTDLISLATGVQALAELDATATRVAIPGGLPPSTKHLVLRLDATRTSTAFGNCRDAVRGARIQPEARDAIFVTFAAEAFFRDAFSPSATLRFTPFAEADADNDGTITTDELDAYPLSFAREFSSFYELPSGQDGSLGDFARAQFGTSVSYGVGGVCDGIAPGTILDP